MEDLDADHTTGRCELERVRQDIDDDLVKVVTVYPYWQHLGVVLIAELDVLRLRLLGEEGMDISDETNQVCLTHMHLHLSFVNLTEVHHLVDES